MPEKVSQPAAGLPGYPADARLLLLNADDFGICCATNTAIQRVLEAGMVRSTSLMVNCAWSAHAMRYLREHPDISFGVHLTAICDAHDYIWRPMAPLAQIPSLVDSAGHFYSLQTDDYFARIVPGELEIEFRAQIEAVLQAGLKPAHLDWHSLRMYRRPELFDVLLKLAREYRLALRAIGDVLVEKLEQQGLVTVNYEFLDSTSIEPLDKAARYARMLRELPAGLTEWAVHPGLDGIELAVMEPDWPGMRQADTDFWTSPQARALIEHEGITLVDYRAIQAAWYGG